MRKLVALLIVLCSWATAQESIKHGTLKSGTLTARQTGSGGGGNLPAGTGWVTLANTNLFTVTPPQGSLDFTVTPPGNNGTLSSTEAYTGGAIDTINNRMIIWGGGHQDYCGNEVYALNLNSNPPSIQRLNNPSQPSACNRNFNPSCTTITAGIEALPTTGSWPSIVSCTGSGCRPNGRHSVDLLAFDPDNDSMLNIGGILTSCGGTHSIGGWSLDLPSIYASGDAGTNWTRLDTTWTITGGALSQFGTGWGNMVWDSGDHLAWVEGGAAAELYYYNPVSNALTQASTAGTGYRDGEMTMAYDPDHNYAWVFGGNDTFNQAQYGTTSPDGVGYWDLTLCLSSPPSACSALNWVSQLPHNTNPHSVPPGFNQALTSSPAPGVAFDPIWHVFVVWQEPWSTYSVPEALYLFNPDPNNTVTINALGITTIAPQHAVQIDTTQFQETTGPLPSYPPTSTFSDVFGRFGYFPLLDVFAACQGYVNCKILRLRTSSETVHETSGTTQTNRPVSLARVFRDGEIPAGQFAQPAIGGQTITSWQCDPLSHWPDGSLKFAVISLVIPSLQGNGSVPVSFTPSTNRDSGLSGSTPTGYLNQAGMLNNAYNFDAQIQSASFAGNVSARTMLNAGAWTYWLQGPVVTAVRIADETTRAYDVNADGNPGNPLHPIFEAWFYPQNHAVDIGYTMEDTWVSNTQINAAQDQTYAFTLTAGNTSPTTVFTQSSFTQIGFSRWHKDFWISQPASVRVDFNTPYWETTGTIPPFDVTRDDTTAINLYANTWANLIGSAQKSITGSTGTCVSAANTTSVACIGDIELSINSGGAHEYVGLEPSWATLYLLSYNDTLLQETLTDADLMGYFPIHLRESDANAGSGHFFDSGGTVGTQGRIVSLNARPTISFHGVHESSTNCGGTWATDSPPTRGTVTQGNWTASDTLIFPTHAPDIAYIPYLVTGKNYYYEELLYQGAVNLGVETGCSGNTGGTYNQHQGNLGLFSGESARQTGWGIRTTSRAAFMALDSSPEKAYITEKLQNNLAFLDGTQGLPNSFPSNSSGYSYGASWIYAAPGGTPFMVISDEWLPPAYGYTTQAALTTGCGAGQANFMQAYLGLGLATARSLGWATNSLLPLVNSEPLNVLFNPAIGASNIYMVGSGAGGNTPGYAYCQRKCTVWTGSQSTGQCTTEGAWLTNYSDFLTYFLSLASSWPAPGQMEDNYTAEVAAFLAMTADITNGGYNAWLGYNLVRNSAQSVIFSKFNTLSPKWDIRPIRSK